MSYENPLMVELMVPRDEDTKRRINGFYSTIGWQTRDHSDDEHLTYVSPAVTRGQAPVVAYWQTNNPDKLIHFQENQEPKPTGYARGLRLPVLQELVEVTLIVPSNNDVQRVFERGGRPLSLHAHVPPREHAGAQEFRFSDPFNYALRVTTDSGGYEITPPPLAYVPKPEDTMITQADFKANWPVGGGHGVSWTRLVKISREFPDFPLRVSDEEGQVMHGDLRGAIDFLNEHGTRAKTGYLSILENILDSREHGGYQ